MFIENLDLKASTTLTRTETQNDSLQQQTTSSVSVPEDGFEFYGSSMVCW